jgi:hypothetical protein
MIKIENNCSLQCAGCCYTILVKHDEVLIEIKNAGLWGIYGFTITKIFKDNKQISFEIENK